MDFYCVDCEGIMETKDFPYFEEELTCPLCGAKYKTDWEEDWDGPSAWLVRS